MRLSGRSVRLERRGCTLFQSAAAPKPLTHRSPLQRLLGVSQPRIAQGQDSQTPIERHAEPKPHGITGPLYAADAPQYASGANSVNAQADQKQPDHDNKYSVGHV